jgi:hypothetical protein
MPYVGKEIVKMPDGSTGVRAKEIPQAALDSGYWAKAPDEFGGMFWFLGTSPMRERKKPWEEYHGPAPAPTAPDGFLDVYGAEPGPNSLKWVWRQARKTFNQKQSPPANSELIAGELAPFGLAAPRWFTNNYGERVLILHEATQNGLVRYLDFPAEALAGPTLDGLIAAWQDAIAWTDPKSFPVWAILHHTLSAESQRLIKEAQEG